MWQRISQGELTVCISIPGLICAQNFLLSQKISWQLTEQFRNIMTAGVPLHHGLEPKLHCRSPLLTISFINLSIRVVIYVLTPWHPTWVLVLSLNTTASITGWKFVTKIKTQQKTLQYNNNNRAYSSNTEQWPCLQLKHRTMTIVQAQTHLQRTLTILKAQTGIYTEHWPNLKLKQVFTQNTDLLKAQTGIYTEHWPT
jgi:hypothetical protein